MRVVARVRPAELDVLRLAAHRTFDECLDRSDPDGHSEPVDGGWADGAEVDAERLVIRKAQKLGGGLGRAVEVGARPLRGENDGVIDVDRLVFDARKHPDRGEVHDPVDVEGQHRLEDVHRPEDVHLNPGRPVRGEIPGVDDHPHVNDLVRSMPSDHVVESCRVCDRPDLERYVVEIATENEPSLRLEAAHVQTDDPAPTVEQSAHDMRADEASRAGDERRRLCRWPALAPRARIDGSPRESLLELIVGQYSSLGSMTGRSPTTARARHRAVV